MRGEITLVVLSLGVVAAITMTPPGGILKDIKRSYFPRTLQDKRAAGGRYEPRAADGRYGPRAGDGRYELSGAAGRYEPRAANGRYKLRFAAGKYEPRALDGR